jgi:ubiquinone/menaquinone biosynthesis C-methylase UbiE
MDNTEYYEKFDWEKANLNEKLKNKVECILNQIPARVKLILDVGCGDGAISNALNSKFEIIALDRSRNALKNVQAKKIISSAEALGVGDFSCDLVFSSEMIEHLTDSDFEKALSEMKRVSKKYVFLTFPVDENIEKELVECQRCGYRFNKIYHLRKLNLQIIKPYFTEYKIKNSFNFGKKIRRYNKFLGNIKHKYSPPNSWIPPRWTPDNRRSTMCPNCQYHFEIPYEFNLVATACDLLNILFSPKKPYQLFILFEKI